jgi:hypothetical protein
MMGSCLWDVMGRGGDNRVIIYGLKVAQTMFGFIWLKDGYQLFLNTGGRLESFLLIYLFIYLFIMFHI